MCVTNKQASNMRIELRCRVVDVYMCYSGVLMLYMLRRVAMCVRPLTRVPRAAMCSDDVACRMYMYTCAPRPTRAACRWAGRPGAGPRTPEANGPDAGRRDAELELHAAPGLKTSKQELSIEETTNIAKNGRAKSKQTPNTSHCQQHSASSATIPTAAVYRPPFPPALNSELNSARPRAGANGPASYRPCPHRSSVQGARCPHVAG